MGTQVILSIHQIDKGTDIDTDAANTALMASPYGGFGELYEEFVNDPKWEGPLKLIPGNWRHPTRLKIAENWDNDFGGYSDQTMVWGCYGDDVFQTIADNMKSGKVVFFVDTEGSTGEYYICTPNTVVKKLASQLTF